ncbi:MAG: RNA polymerase sigma factor [Lachnospiraceae bacterium]
MDTEPLRQLYRNYYNELYLYLYSLCHNRELAQDLVQETFLKAILSLQNDHANARAWLYLVARNLYFNYRSKEKQTVPLDESEFLISETDLPPLEKLIRNEQRNLLYQAMQHIAPIRREILFLQYFCNLSQKEIAAILRQTPENIRVQAYRGKKELKSYLEVHNL